MERLGDNFISDVVRELNSITQEEVSKKEPQKELPSENTFDRIFIANDDIKKLIILRLKIKEKANSAESPAHFECYMGDELFINKLIILSAEKMLYSTYFQKVKDLKVFKGWKMGLIFEKEK
jgi:hypothetical protein